MNLFQLLDGIFEGVIYFVYNVLRSAVLLIVRPRRSPLQLFKAHLHSSKRQISSQTGLLLASLAFSWSVTATESRIFQVVRLKLADVASVPNLQVERFWPYLLSAVLITVVIDVALRTILLICFPRNRIRRLLVLSITEYSLCAALVLAPAVRFFMVFSVMITLRLPEWFFPMCTIILVIAVPIYLAIAAIHLARGLRGPIAADSRFTRAKARAGSLAGVLVLTLCVGVVGVAVPRDINSARQASEDGRELEAITVICRRMSATALQAALVVRNRGKQPVVVMADEFDLVLGSEGPTFGQGYFNYVSDITGFGSVPDRSDLKPLVIEPNSSATISGSVRVPAHLSFELCATRLHGNRTSLKRQYEAGAEGKDIESGSVEPLPVSRALGRNPDIVEVGAAPAEILVLDGPKEPASTTSSLP